MNSFKQDYIKYFKQVLEPFLKAQPSDELVFDWLFDYVPAVRDSDIDLQVFVINNTKEDYIWTSGIGILDGVKTIVDEAITNGNILTQKEYGIHRYGGENVDR